MFRVIITLPILLLCSFYSCQSQDVNFPCQTDSDCNSWLACVNNVCTACSNIGSSCQKNGTGYLSECCPNTTCEDIPGLNSTLCVTSKNSCSTDKDCLPSLQCIQRLGKCGVCHPDGTACTLPYDSLECCSNYCRITDEIGNAVCADPQKYAVTDEVVESSSKWPLLHHIIKQKHKSRYRATTNSLVPIEVSKRRGWPSNLHVRVNKTAPVNVIPKQSSKICTVSYSCGDHTECSNSKCAECRVLHMTCTENLLQLP